MNFDISKPITLPPAIDNIRAESKNAFINVFHFEKRKVRQTKLKDLLDIAKSRCEPDYANIKKSKELIAYVRLNRLCLDNNFRFVFPKHNHEILWN